MRRQLGGVGGERIAVLGPALDLPQRRLSTLTPGERPVLYTLLGPRGGLFGNATVSRVRRKIPPADWLGTALGRQPVAEVRPLSLVHEVGVRKESKAAVPDNRRGIADEEERATVPVSIRRFGRHCGVVISRWPPACNATGTLPTPRRASAALPHGFGRITTKEPSLTAVTV